MANGNANSKDPFLRMTTTDGMVEVDYVDHLGREFIVLVPPNTDPAKGIVKGPPVLDALGLNEETTTRLHNELKARGIITSHDAMHRPQDILGAIQRALRLNVQQVQNIYNGIGAVAAPAPAPVAVAEPAIRLARPKYEPHTTPEPTQSESAKEDVTDAR